MDLLTTPYTLTLPVWGWCLAVPALGVASAYAGYYALEGLAWIGWQLSRWIR